MGLCNPLCTFPVLSMDIPEDKCLFYLLISILNISTYFPFIRAPSVMTNCFKIIAGHYSHEHSFLWLPCLDKLRFCFTILAIIFQCHSILVVNIWYLLLHGCTCQLEGKFKLSWENSKRNLIHYWLIMQYKIFSQCFTIFAANSNTHKQKKGYKPACSHKHNQYTVQVIQIYLEASQLHLHEVCEPTGKQPVFLH